MIHDKMRPRLTRREVATSLALSLLGAFVRGSRVSAQEPGRLSSVGERIKRLERQLAELRQTLKIPGVSAAIVKDQKLLWAKGLGSADVENKIPATPETNYRIASLTKPFASTLLMQLVEQGKLDLDEPMAKYSPEFRQRFGRGPITVRHVFLDDRAKWSAFLDADHARRYEAGLAKLAKPYRLHGAEMVRGILARVILVTLLDS